MINITIILFFTVINNSFHCNFPGFSFVAFYGSHKLYLSWRPIVFEYVCYIILWMLAYFFVMMKYCCLDNNIVLCIVIVFYTVILFFVGLAMLTCTNLLLFCNVIMSDFITYNNILRFIILFWVITIYWCAMSYVTVL